MALSTYPESSFKSFPFIPPAYYCEHRKWIMLINSNACSGEDPFVLELDFAPFNANFPHMTRPSSIGHGVQFLNRHLSSKLFHTPDSMEPLFEFLRMHTYRGQVIRGLNGLYWRTGGCTPFSNAMEIYIYGITLMYCASLLQLRVIFRSSNL